MEPVTQLVERGVPLDRADVDTDQIIPAKWLKRIERTGFEDGLFEEWRKDPDFVLNRPEYAGAGVLVAGPNFGSGSSREHAPWALRDYGFKAVISASFADIFRNNLPNVGMVPVQADQRVVSAILEAITDDPGTEIRIDVERREVHCTAAGVTAEPFALDGSAHYRLVNGLDPIGLTLLLADEIGAYEQTRPRWMPVTGAAAGLGA